MAENRLTAAMERHTRDERAGAIHRTIHEALGRWRDRGWMHDWRIHAGPDASDPLAQRVMLELRLPGGRPRGYSISADEIEMGGLDAISAWLDGIEYDLHQWAEYDRMQLDMAQMAINPPVVINTDEMEHQMRDAFMYGMAAFQKRDATADLKAAELFATVAGKEAFNTLESGKPLPLKGSQGTDYHLFRRASYCIERPSDGARLCAVVPGVPLWDHLLGIKLMVEHDEPMFLKTANVSGGRRVSFSRPWDRDRWHMDTGYHEYEDYSRR